MSGTALFLVLALLGSTRADLSEPVVPCHAQECSNDPVPVGAAGVLGDERLCWDPSERATSYEVCTVDEAACVTTAETCLTVAGTSLVARNDTAWLKVRACNHSNPEAPPSCSAWTPDPVEFMPFVCLMSGRGWPRNGCEDLCYPRAPRRFPHLARCTDD